MKTHNGAWLERHTWDVHGIRNSFCQFEKQAKIRVSQSSTIIHNSNRKTLVQWPRKSVTSYHRQLAHRALRGSFEIKPLRPEQVRACLRSAKQTNARTFQLFDMMHEEDLQGFGDILDTAIRANLSPQSSAMVSNELDSAKSCFSNFIGHLL